MWGRKEKKENMERRKKKQQGHISEKIHLERNMMRAKNGRREERHYLLHQFLSEFEPNFADFSEISSTIHIPKI